MRRARPWSLYSLARYLSAPLRRSGGPGQLDARIRPWNTTNYEGWGRPGGLGSQHGLSCIRAYLGDGLAAIRGPGAAGGVWVDLLRFLHMQVGSVWVVPWREASGGMRTGAPAGVGAGKTILHQLRECRLGSFAGRQTPVIVCKRPRAPSSPTPTALQMHHRLAMPRLEPTFPG